MPRQISLVPEIRHSACFAAIGLAKEPVLPDALAAHDDTRRAPIVLQSFETATLRALRIY